jgi:hypothetical protein
VGSRYTHLRRVAGWIGGRAASTHPQRLVSSAIIEHVSSQNQVVVRLDGAQAGDA